MAKDSGLHALVARLREGGPGAAASVAADLSKLRGDRLVPRRLATAAPQPDAADDMSDPALYFYLQLLLVDTRLNQDYMARSPAFDLHDPLPEYWYQRCDPSDLPPSAPAPTHQWFTGDAYFINTIPPTDGTQYYNAEVYNATHTAIGPSNVIANPLPVDSPDDVRNSSYDMLVNLPYVARSGLEFSAEIRARGLAGGSRGWGFWNTDVFPLAMQIAWFVHYAPGSKKGGGGITPIPAKPGLYACSQNGLEGVDYFWLGDLDEHWHAYRIRTTAEGVYFFIDGKLVHTASADAVPSQPMAFHNWVDNALFGIDPKTGVTHILQKSSQPRSNAMRNCRIRSLSCDA